MVTKRVSLAYDLIRVLPPDVNPVKKILLVVYNVQGQLNIQEVTEGFEGLNRNNNGNNNNSNDQINALLLQHHQMHARMAEMSNTITTTITDGLNKVKKEVDSRFKVLNNNVKRLFLQPTRRVE